MPIAMGAQLPPAYYLELPLKDKELNNCCRLHAQLMNEKGTTASAMKALRNVCKALNARDWLSVIDVTPDFVVAAVDNTGEVDPAKDIKAAIPGTQFRSLRKHGLV